MTCPSHTLVRKSQTLMWVFQTLGCHGLPEATSNPPTPQGTQWVYLDVTEDLQKGNLRCVTKPTVHWGFTSRQVLYLTLHFILPTALDVLLWRTQGKQLPSVNQLTTLGAGFKLSLPGFRPASLRHHATPFSPCVPLSTTLCASGYCIL